MSIVVRSVVCASAALVLAGRFLPARATAAPAARDTSAAPAPRPDSLAAPAPNTSFVATAAPAPAATALLLPAAARAGIAPLTAGAPEALRLVVSLRDRRLWLVAGDTVRFEAPVAVGRATDRALAHPDRPRPEFATPAGRFVVERRDSMPEWVPPDWHYAEQARKRGRGLVRLARGGSYTARDGRVIRVAGGHVVAESPDGTVTRLAARDGREITVDGAIVVPPLGTSARRYARVLGPRRLALGGELGIHGTSDPKSIGTAVTHGCIRLANDVITALYALVPVGTPVYLY